MTPRKGFCAVIVILVVLLLPLILYVGFSSWELFEMEYRKSRGLPPKFKSTQVEKSDEELIEPIE